MHIALNGLKQKKTESNYKIFYGTKKHRPPKTHKENGRNYKNTGGDGGYKRRNPGKTAKKIFL